MKKVPVEPRKMGDGEEIIVDGITLKLEEIVEDDVLDVEGVGVKSGYSGKAIFVLNGERRLGTTAHAGNGGNA